jgi:transcription antitermination protein NusB
MKEAVKDELSNPDFAARLMAVQAHYQISQNEQGLRTLIEEYLNQHKVVKSVDGDVVGKPNATLFKKILIGLDERLVDITSILNAHIKTEPKREIEPLLKAILLCGISEILNNTDTDKALIINDYLNVSHSFYDQAQVSFVNGILDSVAKRLHS